MKGAEIYKQPTYAPLDEEMVMGSSSGPAIGKARELYSLVGKLMARNLLLGIARLIKRHGHTYPSTRVRRQSCCRISFLDNMQHGLILV